VSGTRRLLSSLILIPLLASCPGPPRSPDPGICSLYKLPFSASLGPIAVSQANSSQPSHVRELQYAFDFALQEGQRVLAARDGTVVDIHTGETLCGDSSFAGRANYVVVEHEDGTYALYAHLQSVAVGPAQQVSQGQLLGIAGKTGYTDTGSGCAPHLHFQVQGGPEPWSQSLPVCFSDVPGGNPIGMVRSSQTETVPVLALEPNTAPTPIEYYVSPGTVTNGSANASPVVALFVSAFRARDIGVLAPVLYPVSDVQPFILGDPPHLASPSDVVLWSEIPITLSISEWVDRSTFVQLLEERIANGADCVCYDDSIPDDLEIATRQWSPPWTFGTLAPSSTLLFGVTGHTDPEGTHSWYIHAVFVEAQRDWQHSIFDPSSTAFWGWKPCP
jgi:murein DD-endopeptidase MepM/ murein hydrolase activator NlpD